MKNPFQTPDPVRIEPRPLTKEAEIVPTRPSSFIYNYIYIYRYLTFISYLDQIRDGGGAASI